MLRRKQLCLIVSSTLWTATVFLAVTGVALNDARVMMVALLVGHVATLSVGYLMLIVTLRRERLRLESLATIMANAAAEKSEVTRIRK